MEQNLLHHSLLAMLQKWKNAVDNRTWNNLDRPGTWCYARVTTWHNIIQHTSQ